MIAQTTTTTVKAAKKAKIRDCWSVDGFVRAEDVRHGMSDEELFWRASMVPMKEDYPYDRVPKVAFMFLTRGSEPGTCSILMQNDINLLNPLLSFL